MSDEIKPRYTRKWRNLWLNPSYQGRYIFWLSGSGFLLALLNCAIFYAFTNENFSILVDLSPMPDESKQKLYLELNQIIGLLLGSSFLMIGVIAVLALVFSHRTVGPLYHFKRIFKDIAAGNHSARIHLRKKGHFQDVANSFNKMMDVIQKSD